MHQVVVDGLEEFLARTASPELRQQIEGHLKVCATCRAEVSEMQGIAEMLTVLRPQSQWDVAPGFYSRVRNLIEEQTPAPLWAAFLDPAFFRRTAFACLMILALLGGFVISSDTDYGYGVPGPETMIAIEQNTPFQPDNPVPDQEMMLVTLTSYTQ
ncbi:MAG: hypothetical protein IT158_08785 [Bryobacterales bacterium]|nr:hypothetical protein [Bryobacterales bacterium]